MNAVQVRNVGCRHDTQSMPSVKNSVSSDCAAYSVRHCSQFKYTLKNVHFCLVLTYNASYNKTWTLNLRSVRIFACLNAGLHFACGGGSQG